MEKFHSNLNTFIKAETSIDPEKLELIQISLPFFTAERSGKVRIDRSDFVKVVLRYLTELCQGDMFQIDPTLAVGTTMDWTP